MNPSSTATTPDQYIAQLDESRREQIGRLHDLIRTTVPDLEPYMEIGDDRLWPIPIPLRIGARRRLVPARAREPQAVHLAVRDSRRRQGGYLAEAYRDRLPKADIGKSCVRFRRLDDLDQDSLRELVREAARSSAASAT